MSFETKRALVLGGVGLTAVALSVYTIIFSDRVWRWLVWLYSDSPWALAATVFFSLFWAMKAKGHHRFTPKRRQPPVQKVSFPPPPGEVAVKVIVTLAVLALVALWMTEQI